MSINDTQLRPKQPPSPAPRQQRDETVTTVFWQRCFLAADDCFGSRLQPQSTSINPSPASQRERGSDPPGCGHRPSRARRRRCQNSRSCTWPRHGSLALPQVDRSHASRTRPAFWVIGHRQRIQLGAASREAVRYVAKVEASSKPDRDNPRLEH